MNNEGLNWKMSIRCIFFGNSLFKMKQVDDETFLTHVPNKKKIVTYNFKLESQFKEYTFKSEPSSIQYLTFEDQDYVFAGCRNGQIVGIPVDGGGEIHLPENSEEIAANERYINDLLYVGNNKLINCYNNGCVSMWDLNQKSKIFSLTCHKDYTYKLRRLDHQTIVSCGNDAKVNAIDLNKTIIVRKFQAPSSVWAIHPINSNLIAIAGLFGRILFYDVRAKSIVQSCHLEKSQTSYITKLDQNNIVFGNQEVLTTCNLRKMTSQALSQHNLKVSAESIIITEDGGIVCGRGFELYVLLTQRMELLPLSSMMNFSDESDSEEEDLGNDLDGEDDQGQIEIDQNEGNNQVDESDEDWQDIDEDDAQN